MSSLLTYMHCTQTMLYGVVNDQDVREQESHAKGVRMGFWKTLFGKDALIAKDQGRCSTCGREGLLTAAGVVHGEGKGVTDYVMNRVWRCCSCDRVFCPTCAFEKHDFKCPSCGSKITS